MSNAKTPSLINIYSLSKKVLDLIDILNIEVTDELTGEITIPAEELSEQLLKQLCNTISTDGESLLEMIHMYEGYVETIKERKRQLSSLQSKYENDIERINKNLISAMRLLNMESLSTNAGVLSISKGQPKLTIKDGFVLPDEYLNIKTEITPDKMKIKKAIKDGINFGEGVSLESSEFIRKK